MGIDFYCGKFVVCDYFFGWEMFKVVVWFVVFDLVEMILFIMFEYWF